MEFHAPSHPGGSPRRLVRARIPTPTRLPGPELAPTWVEHLPTRRVDISDQSDLTRADDWIALAALIEDHAPQTLAAFGFPERQAEVLQWLLLDAWTCAEESARLHSTTFSAPFFGDWLT